MHRHAAILPLPVFASAPACRIGGGAYPRDVSQAACALVYRVRKLAGPGEFSTVTQALSQWGADKSKQAGPRTGVIEIVDSGVYYETPVIRLEAGECLQLRAANTQHPVLRMFDYHNDEAGQACIVGAPGSHFTLDGMCVAGGGFDLCNTSASGGSCHVALRHCTLVPGWDPDRRAPPPWRMERSITLCSEGIELRIEHSIAGPIRALADASPGMLPTLHVSDSILDGGHAAGLLLDDGRCGAAQLRASVENSTVMGVMQLRELAWASNSIFAGALIVAQRGGPGVNHCYLAPGSRTPHRMRCHPRSACHGAPVQPRFVSVQFGVPGYFRLAPDGPPEIGHGADDEGEMGAFHDTHHWEPQPPAHEPVEAFALATM